MVNFWTFLKDCPRYEMYEARMSHIFKKCLLWDCNFLTCKNRERYKYFKNIIDTQEEFFFVWGSESFNKNDVGVLEYFTHSEMFTHP